MSTNPNEPGDPGSEIRLAVLGLGTMGRAMTGSARRAGIPVVTWNRNPAAAHSIAGLGVEVAPSVGEAVDGSDVVITMVTDADAVTSIAKEQGLLTALSRGAI